MNKHDVVKEEEGWSLQVDRTSTTSTIEFVLEPTSSWTELKNRLHSIFKLVDDIQSSIRVTGYWTYIDIAFIHLIFII